MERRRKLFQVRLVNFMIINIVYIIITIIIIFVIYIAVKSIVIGVEAKQKNKFLKKNFKMNKPDINRELTKLKKLYESGTLTKKEFAKAKDKILK